VYFYLRSYEEKSALQFQQYITSQSRANASRYHSYLKTYETYVLIVVTFPLLLFNSCHVPIVITSLYSRYYSCLDSVFVMIPVRFVSDG
jgi:hypothetical protein